MPVLPNTRGHTSDQLLVLGWQEVEPVLPNMKGYHTDRSLLNLGAPGHLEPSVVLQSTRLVAASEL